MRRFWLTITLCLAAAPAAAQQGAVRPDSLGAAARPPADSVAAVADTAAAAGAAPQDTTTARLRLGLKPLASPFAITLPPPPGGELLWLRPRHLDLSEAWRRDAGRRLETVRMQLWLAGRFAGADSLALADAAPDTLAWLPEPQQRQRRGEGELLPGVVGEYTDIWMAVQGRGEMGGAWHRERPCEPALNPLGCNQQVIPQLKPDIQFGVQVGGSISDRVHVNVDYDQRREFDAANNINVYYEGREDEILRRLEVGDVAIRLPASSYVTQNIPAGNFGFKAEGQFGPIDFQTVWAQQKGDVTTQSFRLGGGAGGSGSLDQERRLVLDDAEYARGQFFFLVHPDSMAGSPHIDVLTLLPGAAAPRLVPRQGGVIELYREERLTAQQLSISIDHFRGRAVALDGAGDSVVVAGSSFRRLEPDEYVVHPSRLWLTLRTPLGSDEALAVSYVTGTGVEVGTMDAQQVALQGGTPRLQLLRAPVSGEQHRPGRATWPYEMHQVYRLDSSSGVNQSSIRLNISIGELSGGATHRDHGGTPITLLKLMGMDEESPADQLDAAQIYQPTVGIHGSGEGGIGTFVIFPTLRPFAEPAPIPSLGLSAGDALAILDRDANPAIYEEPDPVSRAAAARFRLTFDYSVTLDGLVSSFSLGALGVREGSERITVDGRELRRGVDYTIDYDIGLVTLRDAQSVFSRPDANLQATYEQKSMFQISPTSVFGLNARYRLGERGELNFLGLHQQESSIMSRPQLGQEPSSILMTGVSGRLELGADFIDRGLARVPGLRSAGGSALHVRGELALSAPDPNTRGEAYLEDFEGSDDMPIGLDRRFWRLGSRPGDPRGALGVFPSALDVSTAAPLVWQESYLEADGNVYGALPVTTIDQNVRVAGRGQLPETVLWFGFGDSTSTLGERYWRSVTTPLSTTGQDLSRAEYLEFYAVSAAELGFTLVLDLGSVSEDAFYFDADGNLNGVYPDGRPWGLGILDEEAPVEEGPWTMASDRRGLWNQSCRAEPGRIYRMRDPRSNCARENGLPDTEDLDGNGVLDMNDGAYFRYVVRLDETSPYYVRRTGAAGWPFALYRIPLRDIEAVAVNGASDGTWRSIRHLRMSVVGAVGQNSRGGGADLAIARMRIVGSRWAKRDLHGILDGLYRTQPGASAAAASFTVSPASALTEGPDYAPPPGIREELQDPSAGFGVGGQEFNEKALSLRYQELGPDERAEVFFRYAQQPRNLLTYRQIRLWAVARHGDWGTAGGERLLVKIGSDPRNQYVYRTPLAPATGDRVRSGDWAPEVVIDFDRWFELKVQAEVLLLTDPPPAGEPVVLWSADSIYGIVLEDRARAPNLAAVREMSFAVYNGGSLPASGEVWLNDMRLGEGVRDASGAGSLAVDFNAGDVLQASLNYSDRGALFQQLNQDPTYLRQAQLGVNATVQAGRLTPAGWGVELPVTVSHNRGGAEPMFLERSDVRADRLTGLRETGNDQTRIGASLRKRTPTANPLLGLLVDGTALRVDYASSQNTSMTTRHEDNRFGAGLQYSRPVTRRDFGLVPGFVEGALRALAPGRIEESDVFQRLVGARLRWTPQLISFGSNYNRQESRSYRYDRILVLPSDSAVVPAISPRLGLDNTMRVALQPLTALDASVNVVSSRNLLDPERATTLERERQALERARSSLGGLELGWETGRAVNSQVAWAPDVTRWLRPRLSVSSTYRMDRSPSHVALVEQDGDSVAVLQRSFGANRNVSRSLLFDPRGFVNALMGEPDAGGEGALRRAVRAGGARLEPLNATWNDGLNSQFSRDLAEAGLGYQLGLGGLDDFRFIDGDTASNARINESFQLRGGIRLPLGAMVTPEYASQTGESFDLQGGRRLDRTVGWPRVNVAWREVPLPEAFRRYVRYLGLSAGYNADRSSSAYVFDETTGQPSSREGWTVPFTVNIGLPGGLGLQYSGSREERFSNQLNGATEEYAVSHRASLNGSVRLGEKLENPLQTALQVEERRTTRCRVAQAGGVDEGCTPFNDFRNRSVSLTIDTLIQLVNVGLQVTYVDNQNYVGQQRGSSQFQLNFFGQFNFRAGSQ
jgi:hypothetical protein